ncbi:MAG: CPBP family intramembrane metalloprotease [Roseburia sp.]|nr:CPBP family intramembrane metalloprotease [Roseburia sp.]
MKDIKCPGIVEEARRAQKGRHWLVELLAFVTVYIIAVFGEMLILLPGEMALLYTNADYQAAAAASDMEKLADVSVQIAASDGYAVLKLFATAAMILLVILFCRGFQKRSMSAIGFVRDGIPKECGVGIAAGAAAAVLASVVQIVSGSSHMDGVFAGVAPGMAVLFFLGYLVQGMAEEVLCRSYLMVSLGRRYPMIAAVLVSAVVSALPYASGMGENSFAFINALLFGIFAALYFIQRGSIWGIAAFHAVFGYVRDIVFVVQSGWGMTVVLLAGIVFFGRKSTCSTM